MSAQNKPKLLFLVQLPPPVHGVTMMNELTVKNKALLEAFETHIIPMNYTTEIKDLRKFSFKKVSRFIKIYFQLVITLFKFKPEVIYFTLTPTGKSFYRDLFIVFLMKMTKSKIVYHLHGKGIYEKTKNSSFQRRIYKYVFKSTYVIHLAEVLKKDIALVNTWAKFFIVPNGVSAEMNKTPSEESKGVKRLLFLSNLAETKGVLMFLESCAYLTAKNIAFTAKVVGRETHAVSETQFRQRIQELNLSNHVQYLGPQYGVEKEKALQNSDIFVFPSFNDCFPLVLLEAMKYGLPIVSTTEGAIPNIVDDKKTGYIVERKDQQALNSKLEALINNDESIEIFSQNAREKFLKAYTISSYEKNMLQVLKAVMSH